VEDAHQLVTSVPARHRSLVALHAAHARGTRALAGAGLRDPAAADRAERTLAALLALLGGGGPAANGNAAAR
jgi:hypothetical protein